MQGRNFKTFQSNCCLDLLHSYFHQGGRQIQTKKEENVVSARAGGLGMTKDQYRRICL